MASNNGEEDIKKERKKKNILYITHHARGSGTLRLFNSIHHHIHNEQGMRLCHSSFIICGLTLYV